MIGRGHVAFNAIPRLPYNIFRLLLDYNLYTGIYTLITPYLIATYIMYYRHALLAICITQGTTLAPISIFLFLPVCFISSIFSIFPSLLLLHSSPTHNTYIEEFLLDSTEDKILLMTCVFF